MRLISYWNIIVVYGLLQLCFFSKSISTHLDKNNVQYEYFQFTTKYSEFIVTYDIKSNSSLKLNESM